MSKYQQKLQVCYFILYMILSFNLYSRNPNQNVGNDFKQSEQLLVLSLKVTSKENSDNVAISKSRIVKGGIEKKKRVSYWGVNDYVCFVSNDKNTVIDTVVLVRPLYPRLEYPKDNGKIGSFINQLEEIELIVRLPFHADMKFIEVFKVVEDKKKLVFVSRIDLHSENK
jgi:hypothetical protein